MIEGLEIKETDHAFVEIGEPDVLLTKEGNLFAVEVRGYDTFNPRTGNLNEGTATDGHVY